MVLCWIALPVFAFLAIFSAKYRRLTAESLECMFRTITFKKCQSGLDDRLRSDITGKLMKFSPGLAKGFYNYYKLIAFVLLILFVWAGYASAVGIYNYAQYGNCNGPDSDGFCLLDPTGQNSGTSGIGGEVRNSEIVLPVLESDDPIIGPEDAELTIIEFGCFRCPYTKRAEPVVREIIDYYDGRVNVQFKNMILPAHDLSYESGLATNCVLEQDESKYMSYHDKLFEAQEVLTYEMFSEIAGVIGLDKEQFSECLSSEKYKAEVEADTLMGINAGVHGTPTFFINDKVIVGPKPFRTFRKVIDGELGN